jgi:hypothetical protein
MLTTHTCFPGSIARQKIVFTHEGEPPRSKLTEHLSTASVPDFESFDYDFIANSISNWFAV